MCIYTCICICICVYIHVCIYTFMYMYIHICVCCRWRCACVIETTREACMRLTHSRVMTSYQFTHMNVLPHAAPRRVILSRAVLCWAMPFAASHATRCVIHHRLDASHHHAADHTIDHASHTTRHIACHIACHVTIRQEQWTLGDHWAGDHYDPGVATFEACACFKGRGLWTWAYPRAQTQTFSPRVEAC